MPVEDSATATVAKRDHHAALAAHFDAFAADTYDIDELRDALVLSVKLPDAAGSTLYFPTLQSCETGQTDWSEIAKDGQDPHSLKAPAPSITISAAADAHAPASHSASADSAPAAATDQAAAVTGSGADARSWAGLAAGLGGLVLGGVAFARSGSTRRAEPGK